MATNRDWREYIRKKNAGNKNPASHITKRSQRDSEVLEKPDAGYGACCVNDDGKGDADECIENVSRRTCRSSAGPRPGRSTFYPGKTCDEIQCLPDDYTGACCYPDGLGPDGQQVNVWCSETTPSECASSPLGFFQGNDVSCEEAGCEPENDEDIPDMTPPTGACCLPRSCGEAIVFSECVTSNKWMCNQQGGTWYADQRCSSNVPPCCGLWHIPQANERGLEEEDECGGLPKRSVCRPLPGEQPDPCPNCFSRGWREECYIDGKPCGNRAAFSFVISNVIGEYDRIRDKTILHEISGFGITYAEDLEIVSPRCRDCKYPNIKHRYKVTNRAGQEATGIIAVGTNYECGPDSSCPDGGRWTIIPEPQIGGGKFEIDGPGCLAPNDTCNNQWDFLLEISFDWGVGNNSDYACPGGDAIPERGEYVCEVMYYSGQDTPGAPNTGLAALDLSSDYKWGPVASEPLPKFNIALRNDTCEDEGCSTNWGSRPLFGGGPVSGPRVKFGFNTFSGYPSCPC